MDHTSMPQPHPPEELCIFWLLIPILTKQDVAVDEEKPVGGDVFNAFLTSSGAGAVVSYDFNVAVLGVEIGDDF